MADIFLSYARKDVKRIKFLINGFSSIGLTVWWDAQIKPGKAFADVIQEELDNAKCIVVVWSYTSVKSDWVKNEARFGKEKQFLVPVMIDKVKPPIEFSHIESAEFNTWKSSPGTEQRNFIDAIEDLVKRKKPEGRFGPSKANYNSSVFINCPFNEEYKSCLDAIAFTIVSCGFQPRTTLEVIETSETRLERLFKIISECKYGIHDISVTGLNKKTGSPGYNIPLEIGLFLGAQVYDPIITKQKHSLILDKEKYRYQKVISDLAGLDIASHNNDPRAIIKIVRDWLFHMSGSKSMISATGIQSQLRIFYQQLPAIVNSLALEEKDITFSDFIFIIIQWLRNYEGT